MSGRQVFSFLAAAALGFGVLCAGSAKATIVERVVAIVGDSPILLSELRKRTDPFSKNLPGSASERTAAKSRLFTEMLDRMVDEELLRRAASKAQVTVSREEVQAAIGRVARGNGVSVEELLAEVERSGVSPAQYRVELRRQLLDAKVINLRLQGRIRVSEDDVRNEYEALLAAERRQLPFRAAEIRIQIPAGAGGAKSALAEARRLASEARRGGDFSELSRTHSTDPETQQSGGLLPSMQPGTLPEELDSMLLRLEVGEVSAPVRSGNDYVVLKLVERDPSQLPPFEQARGQLEQRVQLRKMEKARRRWLDGLRKRTHVEIRL